MANVRIELIEAIRNTARTLENSNTYQWGHMGLCNCGFLAQEITQLTKEEIHSRAMARHGDWSEQLNDYCPTSGLPMDDLITELVSFGFTGTELSQLERLSNPDVLAELPLSERHLIHNNKNDVVKYLNTWAGLLERNLLSQINIVDITKPMRVIL